MPEQDPIEQRIAEIEARRGVKSYVGHPQDIPWLIAQLREARERADRAVELEVALHVRDEELADAGDKLFELMAALRKAEQERDTVAKQLEAYRESGACDGSIESGYREASRVAVEVLWTDSPEHIYENPAKVIEWLRDERVRLKQERDEARRRLAWLAEYVVNVRTPLPHGSADLFWYSPLVDEEGDPTEGPTLIERIDAAMAVSKAEPDVLE